jgi:hypothetical protein
MDLEELATSLHCSVDISLYTLGTSRTYKCSLRDPWQNFAPAYVRKDGEWVEAIGSGTTINMARQELCDLIRGRKLRCEHARDRSAPRDLVA